MQKAVLKLGGSSIDSVEKLNTARSTVSSFVEDGYKVVNVISAFRGVTDALKEAIEKVNEDNLNESFRWLSKMLESLHFRAYCIDFDGLYKDLRYFVESGKPSWMKDDISTKGEKWSSRIFFDNLKDGGVSAELVSFDNPNFPIIVKGDFGNARVNLERTKRKCIRLDENLKDHDCVCLPGYGGKDPIYDRVKTLRRGGSDAVATALSYGFEANALWIITDVNGIKRAYTKHITDAPTIPLLCVEELRDAGTYGAKVPNEAAVRPLMLHCPEKTFIAKYGDIEGEKTRIVSDKKGSKEHPVELVAKRDVTVYRFNGTDLHSKISRLESKFYERSIDFISLGGSDYTRKFAVPLDQIPYVNKIISGYENETDISKDDVSLVGIVGRGMAETTGIIARMGGALARKGINVHYLFDVSPASCGVVVNRPQAERATELLYDEFQLSTF